MPSLFNILRATSASTSGMGANLLPGSAGASFRVWAPSATKVDVLLRASGGPAYTRLPLGIDPTNAAYHSAESVGATSITFFTSTRRSCGFHQRAVHRRRGDAAGELLHRRGDGHVGAPVLGRGDRGRERLRRDQSFVASAARSAWVAGIIFEPGSRASDASPSRPRRTRCGVRGDARGKPAAAAEPESPPAGSTAAD